MAFAQIGKNDPQAKALAVCGRSLARLALTEEKIKSIKVPVIVMVGEKDRLIRKLYVELFAGGSQRLAGGGNQGCESSRLHRQATI